MRSPLAPSDLQSVLRPLDEARGLPAMAYLDPAVFEAEQTLVVGAGWACVGRASDVAHPGSWLTADLAGSSLLVVRGEDLELHAFYNICRHRAMPLVAGHNGRCSKLVCPYHGWTYATSGELLSAAGSRPSPAHGALGLRPVRVAQWQGFVFATASDDVPPLGAWMEVIPPWLVSTDLRHLVRGSCLRWDTAANWKLLVANFQESHHFARVHPDLERLTPSGGATTFSSTGPWLGGVMTLNRETVSRSGSRSGRPLLLNEPVPHVYDAMLFPRWLTSLQPDYFLSYRLEPLSAGATRVVAEVFFHPAAAPATYADVLSFWEVVNAQDRAVCEAQQIGVASAGFEPGPFTDRDEGVHGFEQRVARAHLP